MHNILIIGISGGIGQELTKQFLGKGCNVIGTYFSNFPDALIDNKLTTYKLDITSRENIISVYNKINSLGIKFDLILISSGFKSDLDYHASIYEKNLDCEDLKIEADDLEKSFSINTLGPYLIIRSFISLLTDLKAPKVVPQVCILTSSLGTMNNELYGGAYSYRTSKGALHALALGVYCDLNLQRKIGMQFIGPGDVKTKMNINGKMSTRLAAIEVINNLEHCSKSATFQFIGAGGKRILW